METVQRTLVSTVTTGKTSGYPCFETMRLNSCSDLRRPSSVSSTDLALPTGSEMKLLA